MISKVKPRNLMVNIPDVATKVLKARKANNKRIFTVSSNWLPLFGFHSDAEVVEEIIEPGKGFRVRLATNADKKTKKVYMRSYKSRSANPLKRDAKRVEQLIETASQRIIESAMGYAEYAHITFRHGEITFTPITYAERQLLQDLLEDEVINTLVAMTGGVDCSLLEAEGFRVDTVVEYRPQEKRDRTDYTELTALSTLINSAPRVLCNEDIYQLDPSRLAALIGASPITVMHASLQCDDFSTLKTKHQRASSVEDLSSTIDMFIPTLNILDALHIPVLVVENVPGFMGNSHSPNPINEVFKLQLMRRGYQVHQRIFNAADYGGYTTRKRMYMVATTLAGEFDFPTPKPCTVNVWDDIIEPNYDVVATNDVTRLKVTQDALDTGRARLIQKSKPTAPTLLKAQGHDTKDSVLIEDKGRHYKVPVAIQKMLNAIPESFDLDWAPKDKAAQIIGQSICCSLHRAVMDSVKAHVKASASLLRR